MINAVSGMRSAQVKMDAIGNNVANTWKEWVKTLITIMEDRE